MPIQVPVPEVRGLAAPRTAIKRHGPDLRPHGRVAIGCRDKLSLRTAIDYVDALLFPCAITRVSKDSPARRLGGEGEISLHSRLWQYQMIT